MHFGPGLLPLLGMLILISFNEENQFTAGNGHLQGDPQRGCFEYQRAYRMLEKVKRKVVLHKRLPCIDEKSTAGSKIGDSFKY